MVTKVLIHRKYSIVMDYQIFVVGSQIMKGKLIMEQINYL